MYRFLEPLQSGESSTDTGTAEQLVHLEKKYQMKFPQPLKDYYLNYDGQKIKLCIIQRGTLECEVAYMVPLSGDGLTFEKIVDNDRQDGFLNTNLYPLASDRGGNLYYWDAVSKAVFLLYGDDIEHPIFISKDIPSFFQLLDESLIRP